MKTSFIISLLILISNFALAQPSDYLPPTPTVSALGKYVDAPVSLYTGTPEISIPIYEISCGAFKLPITLSYHSGGFRVEEESSWVGMGWSLNATGVITRTIRHLLDLPSRDDFFDTYDGRVLGPDSHSDYPNLYYLSDWNDVVDGMPDMYVYNFSGNSGKFIYLNGAKLLPKKPLLIEKIPIESGWTVKDEQGNTYFFTIVEKTLTRGQQSATTQDISWYLSKIVTITGEQITFTYKDTLFYQSVNVSQTNNYENVQNHPVFQSTSTDAYTTRLYGKELEKIIFPLGEVEFISTYDREDIDKPQGALGALRLTKIKVTDNAGTINKMFYLEHDYFKASTTNTPVNKRLKLVSVTEDLNPITDQAMAGDGKAFKFEYNTGIELPAKNSKSQDHWGYYNGVSNTSLIPPFTEATDDGLALQGTREPNSETSKGDLLTKIIYPTGGYTEYQYESHDYSYINNEQISSEQHRINVQSFSATASAYTNISELVPTTRATQENYFTIPVSQNANVSVTIIYPDSYVIGSQSQAKIELYEADGDWDPGVLLETFYIDDNGDNYIALSPGSYRLKAIGTMNRGFAQATVLYANFDLETVYKKYAGGARVKKIIESDGVNPEIIRKIAYVKHDEPHLSSGVLLQKPIYIKNYYTYTDPEGEGGPASQVCIYDEHSMIAVTSHSQRPLGTGNHVGYSEVQVYYGENGENGITNSSFTTYSNIFGPESDVSWSRGLMLSETYFDSSDTKIKETRNEYGFVGQDYFYGLQAQFAGKHPCAQTSAPSPSYPVFFDQIVSVQRSEFVYLKKQVTEYLENGSAFENKSEYFYDNLSHLQPTRTNIETHNRRLITATSYPDDYTNTTGFLHDLKNAHTISVPVERVTWQEDLAGANASIISGELFIYKSGGKGLVEKIKTLEISSPRSYTNFKFANKPLGILPPLGAYGEFAPANDYKDKADFAYVNGKPVEVVSSKESPVSYIWGYNNNFPIAKTRNSKYDRIAYTGFENNNEGSWDNYTANVNDAYTGKKAFTGSLTKSGLPQDNYNIFAWVKNGTGTPSITGISSEERESNRGWTLYQWKGILSGTVTINTNGSIIDDVRLHPVNSQMTTLTYDPLKGATSITDANNITMHFNYDRIGRLTNTEDHKKNILSAYTYKYIVSY